MTNYMRTAFLVSVLAASSAQAVQITGGTVELSYSAFTEDTDFDKLSIAGSVEFGFNRNVSAQFDLGRDSFGASGVDVLSFGLHGIYHMSDETSFGAFYTLEEAELGGIEDDLDLIGVEFGHEAGLMSFEGYLGRADASGVDGTIVGISSRYEMPNGIGVSGAFDNINVEGIDLQKLTLRLDGDVSQNMNLFVEVGSAKASALGVSDSEPFVGIGGRITFGADRGATFERRSVGDLIPGL